MNLNSKFEDDLRNTLVDAILQLSSVQIFLMVLTSISRVVAIGAHGIMYVHVGIMVVLLSFYFYRNTIPLGIKCHSYVLFAAFAGLFGLYSFGLIGGGLIYLIYCCICASLLLSLKYTIGYFAISVLAICGHLYLTSVGQLNYSFSPEAYNHSANSWLSALLMMVFVIVNICFCIFSIRNYYLKYQQ